MKKLTFLLIVSFCFHFVASAQPGYFGSAQYWQQRVKYNMNIDMNVNTNRFTGKQKLEYSNNSPYVLDKVFYHLYFNAFQPGSNMDIRSQELGKVLPHRARLEDDSRPL